MVTATRLLRWCCCLAAVAVARGRAQVAVPGPEARSSLAPLPPSFLRYPYSPPAPSSSSSSSASSSAAGGSFSKSEAFSAGGGHAFSKSYTYGPEGERVAFSESAAGGGGAGRVGQAASAAQASSGAFQHSAESASQAGAAFSAERQRYGEALSQSSSQAFSSEDKRAATAHRLAQLAEVPLLQPVVPIVEEYVAPPRIEDAILFTTPVPIIEEVNLVPLNLPPSANQINLQSSAFQAEVEKRRKQGPPRGYPSLLAEEQVSVSNYENERRGERYGLSSGTTKLDEKNTRYSSNTQQRYGSTSREEESNTRYSSSNQQQEPLVLIGYPGKPKPPSRPTEQHSSFSSSIASSSSSFSQPRPGSNPQQQQQPQQQPQRPPPAPTSDALLNILDAMQSLLKSSSQRESHRETHRESHYSNKQENSSPINVRYDSYLTRDTPEEILYQAQVNNVNGIKESLQQSGHSQGNTNINNIISQISRRPTEGATRPQYAVNENHSNTRFSETHASRFHPDHSHPHHEVVPQLEDVLHTPVPKHVENASFHGGANREVVIKESVAHATERQPVSRAPAPHAAADPRRKYLVYNGRKYTSEELAQAFNATRAEAASASQAEASTSSVGLAPARRPPAAPAKAPHSSKPDFPRFPPFSAPRPGLFPSSLFGFSKAFFERFHHPAFPVPSASSHVSASASFGHGFKPLVAPTNYFIYPGTVRDGKLPPFVREHRSKDLSTAEEDAAESSD